jgi:hypothetical protein
MRVVCSLVFIDGSPEDDDSRGPVQRLRSIKFQEWSEHWLLCLEGTESTACYCLGSNVFPTLAQLLKRGAREGVPHAEESVIASGDEAAQAGYRRFRRPVLNTRLVPEARGPAGPSLPGVQSKHLPDSHAWSWLSTAQRVVRSRTSLSRRRRLGRKTVISCPGGQHDHGGH